MLAVLALCAAIAGIVAVFIPVVAFAFGPLQSCAIVLALIALMSTKQGGTGLSIAAFVIACVATLVVAVPTGIVNAGISSESWHDDSPPAAEPAPIPDVDFEGSAPELTDGSNGTRGTVSNPYAFTEVVTISDATTGAAVWELTVGPPVDVTAELAAEFLYNLDPRSGAYTGIPVTLTSVGDESIDPSDLDWRVTATALTPAGSELVMAYVELPHEYVDLRDAPRMSPGDRVTFYEVVDAPIDPDGGVLTTIGWSGLELFWARSD